MITKIICIPNEKTSTDHPQAYAEVDSLSQVPSGFTPMAHDWDAQIVEGVNYLANGEKVVARWSSDNDGGRIGENGEWQEFGSWILSAG